MASHDLDVPSLGQHLEVAPQDQPAPGASKKHPLELEEAVQKSPRARRDKKSRRSEGADINVAREYDVRTGEWYRAGTR